MHKYNKTASALIILFRLNLHYTIQLWTYYILHTYYVVHQKT